MSIDARVVGIVFADQVGGPGKLVLEKRSPTVSVGQSSLAFDSAPPWIGELLEKEVWGGSGSIMWKEQEIAKRQGYGMIVFTAKTLHGLGPAAAKRRGLDVAT